VLEDGLKLGKGEWLVGDKYSIVDISGKSNDSRFTPSHHPNNDHIQIVLDFS
jgi:hypothetical protein